MRQPPLTADEKAGALLAIRQMMMTPEWAVYEKHITRLREAISAGMYKDVGESLAKDAGIIHGIDLALHIDDMFDQKKGA